MTWSVPPGAPCIHSWKTIEVGPGTGTTYCRNCGTVAPIEVIASEVMAKKVV